jgi:hypothetical protein
MKRWKTDHAAQFLAQNLAGRGGPRPCPWPLSPFAMFFGHRPLLPESSLVVLRRQSSIVSRCRCCPLTCQASSLLVGRYRDRYRQLRHEHEKMLRRCIQMLIWAMSMLIRPISRQWIDGSPLVLYSHCHTKSVAQRCGNMKLHLVKAGAVDASSFVDLLTAQAYRTMVYKS